MSLGLVYGVQRGCAAVKSIGAFIEPDQTHASGKWLLEGSSATCLPSGGA